VNSRVVVFGSIFVLLALLLMTGLAGADNGRQAPCPDFFLQDPLPIDDWPVIEAADSNTAWAVSLGGLIIKTENGGQKWDYQWSDLQRDPDTPPLRDLSVFNKNTVWICGDGGAVLLTKDGGNTWARKKINVPATSFGLYGISALSDKIAWVVGINGSVYRTVNGGDSWTSHPVPGGEELRGVSALSARNAWVSGAANTVYMTTNGGGTWTIKDPAVGKSSDLYGIRAFNNNDVYAIGQAGMFYTTGDGGGTWAFKNLGNNINLFDISFPGRQKGWVSGTDNYGTGYMAYTANAGQDFTVHVPPQLRSEGNVTGISAVSGGTVWSCTVDGALLRTTDNGVHWDRSDTVWTRALLGGVCAVDERGAWVVGDPGAILRTFNGGRTWVNQASGVSVPLYDIDAADSSTAWAVGEDGAMLKTTDYGSTWSKQNSGTDAGLSKVVAVDSELAWACASDSTGGFVLQTSDGGTTWNKKKEVPGAQVSGLTTVGENRVWFGAANPAAGYIYRSIDGGESWTRAKLGSPVPIQNVSQVHDIKAIDENLVLALVETVVFVDNFLYLYKSNDGGANWSVVGDYLVTGGNLFEMATADGNDVWACGAKTIDYTEPTVLFNTENSGKSWDGGKCFHRTVLFAIDTYEGKATWTAGYISSILRSTNPSIFSISPDSAPNTGTVPISDIAGSMFWDGMEVRLEKDGNVIKASDVNVESPYHAQCKFDLNGAPEGIYDVVAENPNGLENTLEDGFTVTTPTRWYLPEGSTGMDGTGRFETFVLVANPGENPASVDVTYMTPSGAVDGPSFTMKPESRQTVNVAETVPNEWSVSTKVESDSPVVAERAMYYSTGDTYRQCSHGSIGLQALSKDWYMAEGSTGTGEDGSFETWVLVQNPGEETANVTVDFLTETGMVEGPGLVLEPGTRRTVNVADTVPNTWSVSTFIESDVPIAAERSTYWNGASARQAATASVAASSPSRHWFVAEGSTGGDASGAFETWILIENPTDHAVIANVEYQTTWERVAGPHVTLEPYTRKTVNVADTAPNQFDVSTYVMADGPVVVERVTYWNTGTYRQAAHGSVGVMSPALEWLAAEGSTGSDERGGFDTWVLIQNPGGETADVSLTYYTPDGPVDGPDLELPPGSRRSVSIGETLPEEWSISAMVESDQPVIVDRTMYWSTPSLTWQAAQSSKAYGPF
jgi:photosystem II stability/assembly factor-like uncharacterized protein